VKGLQIDQSDTIIATLTSTLNYPDHLPIIYRDRSQRRSPQRISRRCPGSKRPGCNCPGCFILELSEFQAE
jgi:hypothetical protein